MSIDKFGSHIARKYSGNKGYYFCYISLRVKDSSVAYSSTDFKRVLSYNINESSNFWFNPLPSGTVENCIVSYPTIKFIINDKIVDTLQGETLSKGDRVLVIRSLDSSKTGDGVIEIILKIPVSYDEYEQY